MYHKKRKFNLISFHSFIVYFLDVRVVRKGCALETDLYCKPIDTPQYLHKGSCHPWHTKKAIPHGQALRIRRICSEYGSFQERSEELVGWLTNRGYEEGFVREQVDRVKEMDRDILLNQDGGRNRGRGERIPFVVTYHPAFNLIYNIVNRLQPMLDASKEHKKVFPNKRLVSFRRAKNLKNNLVRAKLAPLQQEDQVKGCYRCGKSRCQLCEHMSEGISLFVMLLVKNIGLILGFDCDSSGVVYLLSCKVCGMQYVGSKHVYPFRARFNN